MDLHELIATVIRYPREKVWQGRTVEAWKKSVAY